MKNESIGSRNDAPAPNERAMPKQNAVVGSRIGAGASPEGAVGPTRRTFLAVGTAGVITLSGYRPMDPCKLWLSWVELKGSRHYGNFRAYAVVPPSQWCGPIYVHYGNEAFLVTRIISESELPPEAAALFIESEEDVGPTEPTP